MAKKRLDIVLVERGLCASREKAKTTIMSGIVYVNNQKFDKAGDMVTDEDKIEVRKTGIDYVSRGGLKIEKALNYFDVKPEGLVAMDIGASTGGFTDCLLKRGAHTVFSIDVGYGQLAWALRTHKQVVCMERTNIRYVEPENLKDNDGNILVPDMAVIDVSFISLRLVLPVAKKLLSENGFIVCLIKPQFEAGRENVGKKGVVRDINVHKKVLEDFKENAKNAGFYLHGLSFSPIKGPEGNIEFLGYLKTTEFDGEISVDEIAEVAHKELSEI